MNISYYTIDDLRLPPKRSLRRGRSVEQYSTLRRLWPATNLCLLPGSECWGSQTESMSWSW